MQSCAPGLTDVPPWICVRTSFLDLRAPSEGKPYITFPLDSVEDDLVRTVGEMAAKLRTAKCLAEVRWHLFGDACVAVVA